MTGGRRYGMEINVEETKVIVSKKPSPLQIIIRSETIGEYGIFQLA
jgi:hypothetical protein